MPDEVSIGRGDAISSIPRAEWEQGLRSAPGHVAERLTFMTREHHRVRYFVVQELPRRGEPISPEDISDALGLTPERTAAIVDDLEKNLFFLTRRGGKDVSWAYPVTVDDTGHHLAFSTGERLDAA